MKCPYCGYLESKVVDSRPNEEGSSIRRRRECMSCGKRFTTFETVESVPIVVIKKDGSRELFDRQKLLTGLLRASTNRPVTLDQLGEVVSNIEQTLQNDFKREVDSRTIGEMAMEELKRLDEVAYIRFASVYRKFTDVESFMEELKKLIDEK